MPKKEEVWQICETLLLEEEEILVPLSKLLYLIKEEKSAWDLDLKTLRQYLESRPLFLLYDFPEEEDLWEDCDNEKMAKEGLFKGDKVMLLDKKPSPEDMQQMILGNLDYLYRTLSDKVNNQGIDTQESNQYVKAIAKTKELYNKFSNLIVEEE